MSHRRSRRRDDRRVGGIARRERVQHGIAFRKLAQVQLLRYLLSQAIAPVPQKKSWVVLVSVR